VRPEAIWLEEIRSMTRVMWSVTLAGCLLAWGCTKDSSTPSSPSAVAGVGTNAAADGSTLKATAPTPLSPLGGVRVALGQPVVLLVTNATMLYAPVVLSYRFEVTNAAGAVIETTVVPTGSSTTSRTIAATLNGDQTYQWRARAEYQGLVGPWSAKQSFITPVAEGYNRPGELFDPLTNGRTIGTIGGSGNITWVPGQGIRMNDELAFVVYELPQVFSSGEISVEVTGLGPNGPAGKPRIFSVLDQLGGIASSSRYSFNVQYRGAGGSPDNCIAWKAILGDNANSLEPSTADRFASVYILDPSKVYLWQGFWTPISFRLVVREGGLTGPLVYDFEDRATTGTTDWNPPRMFAFLGTNNGAFVQFDGTRAGMTLRNLWVGRTPRPVTLP
jgi:hypothetical protein